MPIPFKSIEKGQPGVVGGGVKKHYASAVYRGESTLKDLTKAIEKISTVSGADIHAVLYALVDIIQNDLANGYIVRLGELGSMRINLKSEGKATEKEVTSAAIRGGKVIFTPGADLKKMLQQLIFEKK